MRNSSVAIAAFVLLIRAQFEVFSSAQKQILSGRASGAQTRVPWSRNMSCHEAVPCKASLDVLSLHVDWRHEHCANHPQSPRSAQIQSSKPLSYPDFLSSQTENASSKERGVPGESHVPQVGQKIWLVHNPLWPPPTPQNFTDTWYALFICEIIPRLRNHISRL